MSLFRKPRRNVRHRQVSDGDNSEEQRHSKDDDGLQELQSNINKFKEIRQQKAGKKDKRKSGLEQDKSGGLDEKRSALLSFDQDLNEGDDGVVFQVKKTSQSRRLIKHMKEEKKRSSKVATESGKNNGKIQEPVQKEAVNELDSGTNTNKRCKDAKAFWTLSGREAEAVHLEEEDDDSESDSDESRGGGGSSHQAPLQRLLQSGSIPDAAAIHAARKQREAMREGRNVNSGAKDFISIAKRSDDRRREEDADSDSGEEGRIDFAGVRSAHAVKSNQMEQIMGVGAGSTAMPPPPHDDEEESWEHQQIRKAMSSAHVSSIIPPPPPILSGGDQRNDEVDQHFKSHSLKRPTAYNLQGIKGRIKERLESIREVNSRHEQDLDRAVDEMVTSQTEIENAERQLPEMMDRHRFYQDLRGYLTDLVECYGEKLDKIKYLENKYYKCKAEICEKIMERRREDVRDQMKELSSTSKPALMMDEGEMREEEARQRRAAEREGRRRRRLQIRTATAGGLAAKMVKHPDGMSSDDELSTADQTNVGKVRQDVENQARQVMADVVDEFSSLHCVCLRLEGWKETQPGAYSDAFVSLCVPKIVSPLVRLQLLFWNPLTEHSTVELMPWYKQLAMYSLPKDKDRNLKREDLEKDADRKLLSLVIEKVLIVKVFNFVCQAYDPLSTTQSLKLTGLLDGLIYRYPTLTGDSKQVRELLTAIKEKLKSSIENDVYIPIGYPKQFMENPHSQHMAFLNRQFWSAFKLYRNILAWHGILSDQVVGDLAINSVLNRYLVIGLGVIPDASDALNKCRHIVGAIPRAWYHNNLVFKLGLDRFSKFLVTAGKSSMKPHAREVVKLLRTMGATEDSEMLARET